MSLCVSGPVPLSLPHKTPGSKGRPKSASRTEGRRVTPQAGQKSALLQTHRPEIFLQHLFTGAPEHYRGEGCGSADHRASFSSTTLNCSAWPHTCKTPLTPLLPSSPSSEHGLAQVSGRLSFSDLSLPYPVLRGWSRIPSCWTLSRGRGPWFAAAPI